ncbi:hypothetical protein HY992_00505 [Candidatus Micrarchaeota archaeon]|nr:hypothetical protein [Candidatus Micrarchaeota archaeon]
MVWLKHGKLKAQAAVEFVLYFGSFLLVLLAFIALTASNQQQVLFEREEQFAVQIATNFAEELSFAAAIGDGYYKEYSPPSKLLGVIDYNLTVQKNGYVSLDYLRGGKNFSYVYLVTVDLIDLTRSGALPPYESATIDKSKKVIIKIEGENLHVEQN